MSGCNDPDCPACTDDESHRERAITTTADPLMRLLDTMRAEGGDSAHCAIQLMAVSLVAATLIVRMPVVGDKPDDNGRLLATRIFMKELMRHIEIGTSMVDSIDAIVKAKTDETKSGFSFPTMPNNGRLH